MEKAVAKDLSEEHLHAAFRQQFHVGAVFLQRRNIRHRNAVNTLHHHHPFTTIVRVNFRDVEHRAVFKIAPKLNGVGRFPQQIQFINQGLFVLAHHFGWAQTATIRQQTRHPASQTVDKFQIRFNDRQNIRADNFNHHLFTIRFQSRGMNLGDRSRSQRLDFKIVKPRFYRQAAHCSFNLLLRQLAIKRSDFVLQ